MSSTAVTCPDFLRWLREHGWRFWVGLLLFTLAYMGVAGVGIAATEPLQAFDAAPKTWLATGFGLAGVYALGYRYLPAVAAGTFLIQMSAYGGDFSLASLALAAAAGAAGKTLEAFVGVAILGRLEPPVPFFKVSALLKYTILVAMLSTTLGSGVRGLGLAAAGIVPFGDLAEAFSLRWLGSMGSDLMLAPLLLAWLAEPKSSRRLSRITEAVALQLAILAVLEIILVEVTRAGQSDTIVGVLIPLFISLFFWAAIRFGPRAVTAALLISLLLALVNSLNGIGSLVRETPPETFLLVQVSWIALAMVILVPTASITEGRETEKRLRHSRTELEKALDKAQLLAAIVESSEDAVIGETPDGIITSWNKAAERIYGYTDAEILGKPATTLAPPDLAEEVMKKLDGVKRGERVAHYETKRVRKDGSVFDASVSISPVMDAGGRISLAATIARDVTERLKVQEALRESEERYRRLYEEMPVAYLHSAPDGSMLAANRAALKMFGFAVPGELLRLKASDFYAEPAERAELLTELMSQGHLEGRELQLRRADGTVLWGMVSVHLVRDEKGNPIRLETYLSDITPQKRLSEELARSNQDLEQFAYVVSHDLQEPLRMVASYVELLQHRYQGRLDQDADDFIGFAVDGASRMKKMIDDLLQYSRVGTRGKPFQPVNTESVLDQTLANLDAATKESGADIGSDRLPTVWGDESQLIQLFQNLIGNAIKFRGPEPPHIEISARQEGGEFIFAVKDNGIGIDPRHLEKIFVIFEQLHGKQEYPGTGIGLAVCKRIVERHGGRIWAESEPGQGSTFFFTLPAAHD